jgi:hypothetical protein
VTSGENDRRHAPEDVLLLRSKPITHQGETLGFILEGRLELTIETTTYPLWRDAVPALKSRGESSDAKQESGSF